MIKETVKIESLSFNVPCEDLFFKILYGIHHSNLWPKNVDYEKKSIIAAGNIKIKSTDEIIKKTMFGSKLGLFFILSLSAFSKIFYLDRLKLEIEKENEDKSILHIHGRIASFSNERIYSAAYDENYTQLLEIIKNSYLPKNVEVIKKSINKKLNSRKIMLPYFWGGIIWATFLTTMIILLLITGGGYWWVALFFIGIIFSIIKFIKIFL